MYTGTLEASNYSVIEDLERIYLRFNVNRSEDFRGHSLSVSDVVVLHRDGKSSAFYVDNNGYEELHTFLDGPYKYYSTQRPVDIGTFPKTGDGPVHFVNYDKREWEENGSFQAWGYLAYDALLTKKQIDDYELRPASDNPDVLRVSPYQLEAQIDVIGKWEKARRVSEVKRLTWYHSDFGVFVRKEWVTPEHVAERFTSIMRAKSREVENRTQQPIAEQIAEAGKQVEHDTDTLAKKRDKGHEER
jgi:hypothetical protein